MFDANQKTTARSDILHWQHRRPPLTEYGLEQAGDAEFFSVQAPPFLDAASLEQDGAPGCKRRDFVSSCLQHELSGFR
jgi:hypothetical protein